MKSNANGNRVLSATRDEQSIERERRITSNLKTAINGRRYMSGDMRGAEGFRC